MSTEQSSQPSWLDMQRVLPLPEVERLTSLSPDSLRRAHKDKLIRLSKRRVGMKLMDVLKITNGETDPPRPRSRPRKAAQAAA